MNRQKLSATPTVETNNVKVNEEPREAIKKNENLHRKQLTLFEQKFR